MWPVLTTDMFDAWFERQDHKTQEKLLAGMLALAIGGPETGRPLVDTVYESAYTHMKELRVQHRGNPFRAFFAFDPFLQAIILCAAKKEGNEKLFYQRMLRMADRAYLEHLQQPQGASHG